jgi:isoquinoline 1-oxidoreductase subunit beta
MQQLKRRLLVMTRNRFMKSNDHSSISMNEYGALFRAIHREILDSECKTVAKTDFSRRQFIKLTGLMGGGFALALVSGDLVVAATTDKDKANNIGLIELNAFIHIRTDGKIIILSKNPEIGQGVKTSLPMIVAEELDASWEDIVVQQSPVDSSKFGMHLAGGSLSVSMNWDRLRQAGATVRLMLVTAASAYWKVPVVECKTDNSFVRHQSTNRAIHYSVLAEKASLLHVPDPNSVSLKKSAEYTLLGKRISGVDNRAIVTGQPLFGIDTILPEMLYAAYIKCPRVGGKVKSFNRTDILGLPGIKHAFYLSGNSDPTGVKSGVAIVGASTWHVIKARQQLKVEWDLSEASTDSWSAIQKQAKDIQDNPAQATYAQKGQIDSALEQAATTIKSFYTFGFVAHANLEPQNCTAQFKNGKIEFWAPTQAPDWGIKQISELLSIEPHNIKINQTRVGGGFGRRLLNDYMCEVAVIAKKVDAPVQLLWSREDDMQHDFYRPAGFNHMTATLDENNRPMAWQNHFITFSANGKSTVMGGGYLFPATAANEFPSNGFEHYSHSYSMLPLKTTTGAWRAPFTNTLAWVTQSFLHELSVAAGRDHLEFLLELFGEPKWLIEGNSNALNTGRAANVTNIVAEKAGWGKSLQKGRALGLAFHFCHGGHFAVCAEVSVNDNKQVTIHKISCVGDIGPIVNLSGAETQCEGAILDGLSAMMEQEVHVENGEIVENNFHQYKLLRINKVPEVEVFFVDSDYPPTGAGEPALPPLAPAICNAIFSASNHRIYTLPISKEGFYI